MDDQELKQRRETIRVILTEIFMFLSAVTLVLALTLIVMGYRLNPQRLGTEEELIQRLGLLQVSSRPSGATITVDGNTSLLLRTNASREAAAGEHEVSLSKDGYLPWNKRVEITKGLMYRLNYPRLFLAERSEEEVLDLATVSWQAANPNGMRLFYIQDQKLYALELGASKPSPKLLLEGVELREIGEPIWSGNGERALVKADGEWTVLSLKNSGAEIISLAGLVPAQTSRVEFETENGDRILFIDPTIARPAEAVETASALEITEAVQAAETTAETEATLPAEETDLAEGANTVVETSSTEGVNLVAGNLYELSLNSKNKTLVCPDWVSEFDNSNEQIFYLTGQGRLKVISVGETKGKELKYAHEEAEILATEDDALTIGGIGENSKRTDLIELKVAEGAQIKTVEYYAEVYFAVYSEGELNILKTERWPSTEETAVLEPVWTEVLQLNGANLVKKGRGMVFAVENAQEKLVFDAELARTQMFRIEGSNAWLDEFLRYEIRDGQLWVVDYDGFNWQCLLTTGANEGFAQLSRNGKYLYYLKGEKVLYRQRVS